MQTGIHDRDRIAVAQREAFGEPRRAGQHTAHRHPVEIVDEIGQSGTLGVHRGATPGQIPDLLADNVVGRQFGGELFGEAAGQDKRVGAVRQRFVQRVEVGHLRPGPAQQLGVLGVAEAEGLARRECHRDIGHRFCRRAPGFGVDAGGGCGHHGPEIDVPGHQGSHRGHGVARLTAVFDGGDEPEMP